MLTILFSPSVLFQPTKSWFCPIIQFKLPSLSHKDLISNSRIKLSVRTPLNLSAALDTTGPLLISGPPLLSFYDTTLLATQVPLSSVSSWAPSSGVAAQGSTFSSQLFSLQHTPMHSEFQLPPRGDP